MWNKIKAFYLYPFLGLGSVAVFGWSQNRDNIDFAFGTFLLFVGLIAPLLIGRFREWMQIKWLPKQRKKVYEHEPFLKLQELGFVNKDDFYFEGVYKGYHVYIVYDRSIKVSLNLFFFYKPDEISDKALTEQLRKVVRTKFQMSVLGNLLTKIETNFKICDFNTIETRLNEGIQFLEENGYKPIHPEALKKMYEKYQKEKK